MSDYLDLNNEELLKDFFSEAEQQVENLESNILVVENDPTNHEAIDEIFRAAHTLKGGSATVEMNELTEFTHVVEDLLDELRSGSIQVTEDVVNILLSAIDIIKNMLESRSNGQIYEEDVGPIIEQLKSFIPAKDGKKKAQSPSNRSVPVQPVAQPKAEEKTTVQTDLSEYELFELKQACKENEKLWKITVIFDEENPMNSVGGIQVFSALKPKGTVLKTTPDFDALYEDEFHLQVVYYVASTATADELEDVSFMSDVTISTDAVCLDDATIVQTQTEQQEKPAASEELANNAVAETDVSEEVSEPQKETAEATELQDKPLPVKKPAPKAASSAQHNSGGILRVDAKRIDYLLNLVSETVITKAAFNQTSMQVGDLQTQLHSIETSYKDKVHKLFDQIPKYIESSQNGSSLKEIKSSLASDYGDIYNIFDDFDASFKNIVTKFRSSTQNLGRIASELQEGVMKIRMVPISQIFSRFPRVVRDLSRDLNKKVNLIIEGEDTELDKSVIEELSDPIMHCVRNSLDHGIETPAERKAAGKNEEGTVLLKASNEGNMIIIDIVDDGHGISVDKIKAKAIQRGLIHPNKIITDQEAYQLMFAPGFSTAEKITNVSGRGVGLDVVKTQIEKLNGTILISSEPGMGSKFSIRLPLTVAIIQGLLIRVGSEVYSIPIASVIESVRVRSSEINMIDNYEVLNLRNEVISILRLNRLFGIKNTTESEYSFIVIVGTQDKKVGVMVDALIGEEDVVIKPLRDQFTNSPGIAGASILGDGSVSLIIDVSQLLELGVKQELTARNKLSSLVE